MKASGDNNYGMLLGCLTLALLVVGKRDIADASIDYQLQRDQDEPTLSSNASPELPDDVKEMAPISEDEIPREARYPNSAGRVDSPPDKDAREPDINARWKQLSSTQAEIAPKKAENALKKTFNETIEKSIPASLSSTHAFVHRQHQDADKTTGACAYRENHLLVDKAMIESGYLDDSFIKQSDRSAALEVVKEAHKEALERFTRRVADDWWQRNADDEMQDELVSELCALNLGEFFEFLKVFDDLEVLDLKKLDPRRPLSPIKRKKAKAKLQEKLKEHPPCLDEKINYANVQKIKRKTLLANYSSGEFCSGVGAGAVEDPGNGKKVKITNPAEGSDAKAWSEGGDFEKFPVVLDHSGWFLRYYDGDDEAEVLFEVGVEKSYVICEDDASETATKEIVIVWCGAAEVASVHSDDSQQPVHSDDSQQLATCEKQRESERNQHMNAVAALEIRVENLLAEGRRKDEATTAKTQEVAALEKRVEDLLAEGRRRDEATKEKTQEVAALQKRVGDLLAKDEATKVKIQEAEELAQKLAEANDENEKLKQRVELMVEHQKMVSYDSQQEAVQAAAKTKQKKKAKAWLPTWRKKKRS